MKPKHSKPRLIEGKSSGGSKAGAPGQAHYQDFESGSGWKPTPRQIMILALLAEDMQHKEIAVKMGITRDTVNSQVKRMHSITNKHTGPGLIAWAFRNGYVH